MRDVKDLRKVCHLTQKELAKKIDVHVLTVSRWERGIRKPQAKHERKLEKLLLRRMESLAKIVPITKNSNPELIEVFDLVQQYRNREITK